MTTLNTKVGGVWTAIAGDVQVQNPINDFISANTQTPWVNGTYLNSWTTADVRPAQYCKIGNIVFIRGVVTGGALGNAIFNLPAGFRPTTNIDFATISGPSATLCAVSAQAVGNIVPFIGAVTAVEINFSFIANS